MATLTSFTVSCHVPLLLVPLLSVPLLLVLLLGDTAGNCAASQHRESVTILPLCNHCQVIKGRGGGGKVVGGRGEGGERDRRGRGERE